MKKLLSLILITIIIFSGIANFALAEENSYKYLNKTIIEKLDKKIDSLKWNKSKTLILLISKIDKIIKREKNEIKKALYSELNEYLKLKKKGFESNWIKDLGYSFEIQKNDADNHVLYLLKNWEKIKINTGPDISAVTFLWNLLIYDLSSTWWSVKIVYDLNLMKEIQKVHFWMFTKDRKFIYSCMESWHWPWDIQVLNLSNFEFIDLYKKLDIEKNNLLISKCSESINNTIEFQLSNSFENPTTVLNYTYNFETKKLSKINESSNWKNALFSQEQIKNILKNIDKWIEVQIERPNSNTLIQWDFKAEYIAPKDYTKDTDKIIVTVSWKKYELPWVYGEKEKQEYLKDIKNQNCSINEQKTWKCWFIGGLFLRSFSPSWYYLLYNISYLEWSSSNLVNIATWKIYALKSSWVTANTWTKDKKQFIYWACGYGMWCDGGLYITIKWDFPNTKKIYDGGVEWLYVDDSYIYTIGYDDNSNPGSEVTMKLLIYDLKTLKLVYSQDVDRKD